MRFRRPTSCSQFAAILSLLISFSTLHAKSKHPKPPKPVPAPGALDGKAFLGAFTESGVHRGREELIEFQDGKFQSTLCRRYGFGTPAYFCTRRVDGSLRFTASASTDKIGTMNWDVVVYGNRLDGVMTWAESMEKIHTYGYHALLRQPPAGAGK